MLTHPPLTSSFLACNSGLRSAIRQHHPPRRAVLGQICCFWEHKVVLFQILSDGVEPRDAGRPSCLPQSARGEANRILLASVLSSMRIICPNRVSRRDWIIAVSLGWFVSLCISSFHTNWYHLMPSSICRHHWSSTLILRASTDVSHSQRYAKYVCATYLISMLLKSKKGCVRSGRDVIYWFLTLLQICSWHSEEKWEQLFLATKFHI